MEMTFIYIDAPDIDLKILVWMILYSNKGAG